MLTSKRLSQKQLREIVHYNPETGIFTWIKKISAKTVIGNKAGSISTNALVIKINKLRYAAGSLAYLYIYGYYPRRVEHLNGDALDNRFSNLKDTDVLINENSTLSYESMISYLRYNPFNGIIYRNRNYNNTKAGEIACSINGKSGYKVVSIFRKRFYAHRLAWFLYYGKWPVNYIDHINGNKSDNRIENLRQCTQSQNLANSWHKTTKLVKNVTAKGDKFRVRVNRNNEEHSGGVFDDYKEACLKAKELRNKLHGTFARHEPFEKKEQIETKQS